MASAFSADHLAVLADADQPELVRVAALIELTSATVAAAADRAAFDAVVVATLNEPLWVLRAFTVRLLAKRNVSISADTREHRLRHCPHDRADHVADSDTPNTGRAFCADCDGVVVDVDHLHAVLPELGDCSFFRGPSLPILPWWSFHGAALPTSQRAVFKGQRVNRWDAGELTVGGDPADDCVVAALDPAALRLRADDDGLRIEGDHGWQVVVQSVWWSNDGDGGKDMVLARAGARAPGRCWLRCWKQHRAEAVVVEVDRADALSLDVVWVAFRQTARLRLYEPMPLSFDGLIEIVRTIDGVVVHFQREGQHHVQALTHDVSVLVSGHGEVLWRGLRLEVRDVAPPLAGAAFAVERLQRAR